MEPRRFDDFARELTFTLGRRKVLGRLGTGIFAALGPTWRVDDAAGKKGKRKKKGQKRSKPNAYGCLNVGAACRSADACCSGICEGKRGKKTCRAHHVGPCKKEFDGCQTLIVGCGMGGFCFRTTGQASFCGGQGGKCMVCAKDADCEATHGAGAACVVCDDCIGIDGSKGTVCYPAAPGVPAVAS